MESDRTRDTMKTRPQPPHAQLMVATHEFGYGALLGVECPDGDSKGINHSVGRSKDNTNHVTNYGLFLTLPNLSAHNLTPLFIARTILVLILVQLIQLVLSLFKLTGKLSFPTSLILVFPSPQTLPGSFIQDTYIPVVTIFTQPAYLS